MGIKGIQSISGAELTDDCEELNISTIYGDKTVAYKDAMLERCHVCKGKEHMIYDEIIGESKDTKDADVYKRQHMDTAPDFSGENVNPQIIPEYDGGDVKLGDSEYALTLKDFPHLASLKGRTLITTDGSTLLGADDKAGVAEIMTMAEQVITENIPHGKICIGITPDEDCLLYTSSVISG